MDTQLLVALVGVGGTLAGSLLSPLLSRKASIDQTRELVALERTRSMEERLWEIRRVSYSEIVAHLTAVAKFAANVDDGYNGPQSNAEYYDASDDGKEQRAELWGRWRLCLGVFDQSRLVLSDEFAGIFEAIQNDLARVDDGDLPPEIAQQVASIFEQAAPKLLNAAKAELTGNTAEQKG